MDSHLGCAHFMALNDHVQVDNFELFLGSRLDANGDGEISETERAKGKKLLEELKKNFTFGLDVRCMTTAHNQLCLLVHSVVHIHGFLYRRREPTIRLMLTLRRGHSGMEMSSSLTRR